MVILKKTQSGGSYHIFLTVAFIRKSANNNTGMKRVQSTNHPTSAGSTRRTLEPRDAADTQGQNITAIY